MPDSLPSNILTGFSPATEYALRADTEARLKAFNTGPNVQAPEMFQFPEVSYDDMFERPETTPYDFTKDLFSEDVEVQAKANETFNRSLYLNKEYMAGVNNPKFYDYDPSLDRYLKQDLGYMPGLSREENEARYYDNQGFFDNLGKGVGRFLLTTFTKFGSSVGFLGGLVNPANWGENFIAAAADNKFSRFYKEQEEIIKNELLPVYKPEGYAQMGTFEKASQSAFWADEAADGFAFLASAYLTGRLSGTLGSLASKAEFAGKGAKAAKFLTGATNWSGVAAWAANTASESLVEASESKRAYEEKEIAKIRSGESDKTLEQVRAESAEVASGVYRGNLAVLALPNAFENAFIFSNLKKRVGAASPETIADLVDIGSDLTAGVRKSSVLEGILNPKNAFSFYGRRAALGLGVEGLWEENAQLAVQRINSGDSNYSFAGQLYNQTIEAFKGNDVETSDSIFLGGVIGQTSLATSKLSGERKALIKRNEANKDLAEKSVLLLNDHLNRWMNTSDIYVKDSSGSVVFENGKPVVDEVKLKTTVMGMATLNNLAIQIESTPKGDLKDLLQSSLFNTYIIQSINSGVFEKVVERLQSPVYKNPELLEAQGLNASEVKNSPEQLIKKANFIKDTYDKLDKLQTVNIPPGTSPEATRILKALDQQRKSIALNRLIQNEDLRVYQDALLKTSTEAESKFRDLSNSLVGDIVAGELNSLTLRMAALEDVIEVRKRLGAKYDYFAAEVVRLSAQRRALKDAQDPSIFEGLEETPNGFYLNPKQKLRPEFIDYLQAEKKKAEVLNTIAENEEFVSRLLNPAFSIDDLDSFTGIIEHVLNENKKKQAEEKRLEEEKKKAEQKPPGSGASRGINTPSSKSTVPEDDFEDEDEEDDENEFDPTTIEDVSIEEYEEFVASGEISEEALDNIAKKIINNIDLNENEQDIYLAKSEAVEERLKKEAETREKQKKKKKATIEMDPRDKENQDYQSGRLAFRTPLKTTTQEVISQGGDETDVSTAYQAWVQTFLSSKLSSTLGIYPATSEYRLFIVPDRIEWDYNKSKTFDPSLLSAVIVVTDKDGNPVLFDENYNPTTDGTGRVISYSADRNYIKKDITAKVSAAYQKGVILNGKIVFLNSKEEVFKFFNQRTNELNDILNKVTRGEIGPVELAITSVEANNEVPTGELKSANEVFGQDPIMRISGGNMFMEVDEHFFKVMPSKINKIPGLVDTLNTLYSATYPTEDAAFEAVDFFHMLFTIKRGVNLFEIFTPVKTANGYTLSTKFSGKDVDPKYMNYILTKMDLSLKIADTYTLDDTVTIPVIENGVITFQGVSYGDFLKDKFTTNLAGTPNLDGSVSYRPMNSYFTFDYLERLTKPKEDEFVYSSEQVPKDREGKAKRVRTQGTATTANIPRRGSRTRTDGTSSTAPGTSTESSKEPSTSTATSKPEPTTKGAGKKNKKGTEVDENGNPVPSAKKDTKTQEVDSKIEAVTSALNNSLAGLKNLEYVPELLLKKKVVSLQATVRETGDKITVKVDAFKRQKEIQKEEREIKKIENCIK